MNPADAIRAISKFPDLLTLPIELIQALVEWLDGGDDHPSPTEALDKLPSVLRSELALARMRERAARG